MSLNDQAGALRDHAEALGAQLKAMLPLEDRDLISQFEAAVTASVETEHRALWASVARHSGQPVVLQLLLAHVLAEPACSCFAAEAP